MWQARPSSACTFSGADITRHDYSADFDFVTTACAKRTGAATRTASQAFERMHTLCIGKIGRIVTPKHTAVQHNRKYAFADVHTLVSKR